MSKELNTRSYLEELQAATNERDELFEFVNQHISDLIEPLVEGLKKYLALPRGYVEITNCSIDDGTIIMIGSIFTHVGDHVADAYFGVPTDILGDAIDPPSLDQLVEFMDAVDSKREVRQRDSIIQLIADAEMQMYHDNGHSHGVVPSVTEMHLATQNETLTEYNHRNTTSLRTLH